MSLSLYRTDYWSLIIWLFVGGAVLSFLFTKKQEVVLGNREERWRVLPALLFVLPYIIWAGYRSDAFGDTAVYRSTFKSLPSAINSISTYITEDTKDKGFVVLQIVFKSIISNSDVIFFLLIAAFQMLCLTMVYRKYSSDFWTSIFLFVASTDYLSWMHNGMRQFIAVTGVLACFGLIVRKKYIPTIIIILLLSTIHASALIMIPIIFIIQGKAWNRKTILFIVGVVAAILFLDQFTTVLEDLLVDTQYSEVLTGEVWINDDGENILRVLVNSMPAILSIIGKKYVDQAENKVINICVNASICSAMIHVMAWATSGIYVARLASYVGM